MAEKKRYDTWTYASANSITVPGDMTGTYWPGMRVALKQGTIKFFVIDKVEYSSPNTTITLNGFGIYSLTNNTISAHIDTLEACPEGFPAAAAIPAIIPADYVIYTDSTYIYCRNSEGDLLYTEAAATGLYTILTGIIATGVRIFILPGNYTLSQKISISYSNVEILGTSKSVVITAKNSLNDDMVYVNGSGIHNVVLADFILNGNKANQTSGRGIYINTGHPTDASSHILRNIDINNPKGDGLVVEGDTGCCKFEHLLVMDGDGSGYTIAGSDHIFFDLVAGACKTGGFNISAGSIKATMCKAFYCGQTSGSGWYIVGDRGLYSGCEAQDCYGNGIVLDGADNCLFFGPAADSNGTSIDWQSGIVVYNSDNNIFSSPAAFDRQLTPTQHWGIHVNGDSTGNTVIRGSYSGNVTADYYDESTGNNFIVGNIDSNGNTIFDGSIYTPGKLSMRPFIEIGRIAQNTKPTIVQRGASSGYSLPIYNSDNEELFISEYIEGRWNGASNITLSIIGYIDTDEDVNDDFALQVSWINKSTSSGILPATTTDVTTVTNIETDRNVQYSIYKVDFAIDWDLNDPDIVASDYFAARIRRVAVGSGNVEMSGEFVITMIIITYDVDKVFKST